MVNLRKALAISGVVALSAGSVGLAVRKSHQAASYQHEAARLQAELDTMKEAVSGEALRSAVDGVVSENGNVVGACTEG